MALSRCGEGCGKKNSDDYSYTKTFKIIGKYSILAHGKKTQMLNSHVGTTGSVLGFQKTTHPVGVCVFGTGFTRTAAQPEGSPRRVPDLTPEQEEGLLGGGPAALAAAVSAPQAGDVGSLRARPDKRRAWERRPHKGGGRAAPGGRVRCVRHEGRDRRTKRPNKQSNKQGHICLTGIAARFFGR